MFPLILWETLQKVRVRDIWSDWEVLGGEWAKATWRSSPAEAKFDPIANKESVYRNDAEDAQVSSRHCRVPWPSQDCPMCTWTYRCAIRWLIQKARSLKPFGLVPADCRQIEHDEARTQQPFISAPRRSWRDPSFVWNHRRSNGFGKRPNLHLSRGRTQQKRQTSEI